MRIAVPLCALVVFSALAMLAHAVVLDSRTAKAVEILHAPRLLLAGDNSLGFMVRIRGAIDEDRVVFAMLCEQGGPCGVGLFEHERWSQLPIEGSASPKLWTPKPWTHLPEGEFLLVAGIGPVGSIRASASLTVSVIGQ